MSGAPRTPASGSRRPDPAAALFAKKHALSIGVFGGLVLGLLVGVLAHRIGLFVGVGVLAGFAAGLVWRWRIRRAERRAAHERFMRGLER